MNRILAFAAVVEIGTGVVLMVDPDIVVRLLLGVEIYGVAVALGRCFGAALLGLGLASWPGRGGAGSAGGAVCGMLAYNALVATYLAFLGAARHLAGPLLWPAVLLHAVVAVLLLVAWVRERAVRRDAR
jgi:hypothetical protein